MLYHARYIDLLEIGQSFFCPQIPQIPWFKVFLETAMSCVEINLVTANANELQLFHISV